MNNRCCQMQDKIADAVLGLLNQEQLDVLNEHIDTCPECSQYVQALKRENHLLAQLGQRLDEAMAARQDSVIESLNRSVTSEPARLYSMGRIIVKSKMAKLAAAAVVVLGLLVWANMFFSSEPDSKKSAGGKTELIPAKVDSGIAPREATDAAVETAEKFESLLQQVRRLYAAGDIEGLTQTLGQCPYEGQVAAANFLAETGGAQALGLLEKLRVKYGGPDDNNPYAGATEILRGHEQALALVSPRPQATGDRARFSALADASQEVSLQGEAQSYPYTTDGNETGTTPGPELTDGASGKGYYFDAHCDHIEVPPIEGLDTEHTKMLWVYLESWPLGGNVYLIDQDQGKHVGNNNWIELVDSDSNGAPNIRAGFDAGNHFDSDGDIKVGYWHHIAVVSTSAGDVYTYINGLFDSSRSDFSTSNQPSGILIGATSSSNGGDFKGIIDEVAFFNRVLSDEEIWRIYQNGGRLRGYEQGLIGYWNFDYDKGDIVKDRTRYGNDGTLCQACRDAFAAPTPIQSDGECRPELTKGVSGKGYYFDGDGDYIEVRPIEGLTAEHTKTLWVNADPSKLPHFAYLIDQDHERKVGCNNWIELVDSDSNGAANIRAGFDGRNFFDSDGEIEVGCWYHITVVSTSAGDVFTYINGLFDSSRSGLSTENQPDGVLIGACFKGIIDEVAFFNRTLSDEEIWRIYQNGGRLRGYEQGLIGYWNFDYDQGDIVKDRTRYGNDGKLGQAVAATVPEVSVIQQEQEK